MSKTIFWVLVISIIGNGAVFSQPEKKSWELSTSGYMGAISGESDGSSQFIALDLRAGHFVSEKVEIEPDLQWISGGGESMLGINANIAYNFVIPNSNTMPFVLIGYGRTNSLPFLNTLFFKVSDKYDVSIINFGGGLKLFAARNVVFRIEYRHQRFSYTREYYGGSTDYTVKHNNILLGFSIFFGPAKPGK